MNKEPCCSNEFQDTECGECGKKLEYRIKREKTISKELDLNYCKEVCGKLAVFNYRNKQFSIKDLRFTSTQATALYTIEEIYYYKDDKFVVLCKEKYGNIWLSSLHGSQGKCISSGSVVFVTKDFDLVFKKKEKKIYYVNIYIRDGRHDKVYFCGDRHSSYEAAKQEGIGQEHYIKTIKIEEKECE